MWGVYFSKIKDLMDQVAADEKDAIEQGAQLMANTTMNGGIIHVFGSGHSHMLGEELFYRAGGLASIHPILIESIMLHKGAENSSILERQSGWIEEHLADQDIRAGDIVLIASTSGRNPVPIEVAEFARTKGASVIAITSLAYAKSQSSRHRSGKFLYEVCDHVIDNHIAVGDALLTDHRHDTAFGSGSSVIGLMIANALVVQATSNMIEAGFEPPIFKSNNAFEATVHNRQLVEAYQGRIPMLATNLYK